MAPLARAGACAGLAILAACGRPSGEQAAAPPARKAGLWEQSLTRDGQPGRLGVLRVCLDAATDSKFAVFGRHFAKGACQRSVTRTADGIYHFSSTCADADGATVKVMGTAAGDFATGYKVRSEVNVSGAALGSLNGMHEVDMTGRYLGPCPPDMRPGDVNLGSGLKVNIDRLPQIARAVGGG
jgi:hypothetical protein